MSFIAKVQVKTEHYTFENYCRKEPWLNFWYQIKYVLSYKPEKILEIGPGTGVVTNILKKNNVQVTTLDIDESLNPDVVGSVDNLPFSNDMFDLVLCCEVLEHLPYDCFLKALKEIRRVTKGPVIIGLPNASGVLLFILKIPIFHKLVFFTKIPFFWKIHKFNGEHYWETGKKGHSISKTKKDIESAGFFVKKVKIHYDDPAHLFFVLEKV
ncbi:MAG: methyltransferase type 11 [Candidatus Magasanikbacteria bacterium]|nr:methyltransferase type 11 [Candidatus Magasanikbacteria bacterium]|tara:strand:- start:609 stop:1241 length:633 start_codon:yes stop_codon:yes gene_type:complete